MIRLSETICDTISKAILDGAFTQGERLPSELDMAAEYQVSRPVIRESLRRLESLGLVTVKKGPTGGIFVAHNFHKPVCDTLTTLVNAGRVSPDNIFDVMQVLMGQVATRAAVFGRRGETGQSAARPGCDSKEETEGGNGILSGSKAFFLNLAALSHNPALEVLINAMMALLQQYFSDTRDPGFENKSLIFQEKMSNCILEKDAKGAQSLVNDHIIDMRRRLYQMD